MTSSLAPPISSRIAIGPLGALAGGALALALVLGTAGAPEQAVRGVPAAAIHDDAGAPAAVPNRGQADASVRFEARGDGATLFFTDRDVVLARPDGALRMRFIGAHRAPMVTGAQRRPGIVNDLRGQDPARWRTGLPTFGAVTARGLYPGVEARHDIVAGADGPWVRSTYTVAPGGDPARIRWRYTSGARVDPRTGALRAGPGDTWVADRPVAWQMTTAGRAPVDVSYRVGEDGTIGFALGRFDRAQPLIIGPAAGTGARSDDDRPALRYSTFLGGKQWDEMYDVDVSKTTGDAYVTGFSFSPAFPVRNAQQPEFHGVYDAVVTRLSERGAIVYSTYLGGDAADAGHNIAVDTGGNAYVTGRTESEDFPVRDALRRPLNGRRCQGSPCHDAFVTKLDPSGRIAYSTYLGGTGNEEGWGIAVDPAGRAHVTGNTDSDDFPTRSPLQPVNRSRGCEGDVPCPFDTFVAKFAADGSSLRWSTYLGGKAGELNGGVALDTSGDVYVAGTTRSGDFPVKAALQPQIKGLACGPPPGHPCLDNYVTAIDDDGQVIEFSTYLGGSKSDRNGGIAVDKNHLVYLTGSTLSTDFPTVDAVQKTARDLVVHRR